MLLPVLPAVSSPQPKAIEQEGETIHEAADDAASSGPFPLSDQDTLMTINGGDPFRRHTAVRQGAAGERTTRRDYGVIPVDQA
jgi:hypothetical protein